MIARIPPIALDPISQQAPSPRRPRVLLVHNSLLQNMKDDGDTRRIGDPSDTKKQKLNPSSESKLAELTEGEDCLGWLLTFASSEDQDQHSCVDLHFVREDGTMFYVKYKFRPYFCAAAKDGMEHELAQHLRTKYSGRIAHVEVVNKADLDLENHLPGLPEVYLKISFDTVQQMVPVKSDLMGVVKGNQDKDNTEEAPKPAAGKSTEQIPDPAHCIDDLKEYDEPYHVRFAIDNDIRSGRWYDVNVSGDVITVKRNFAPRKRAKVCVCAFNIKSTNSLGGSNRDLVYMISYMVDGQGYLIVNREFVDRDVVNLRHTQRVIIGRKPVISDFAVENVKDEKALITSWFSRMKEVEPGICVTYHPSDWELLASKADHYGLRMNNELNFVCRLDCFAWVKRDLFHSQGSHDLKDVARYHLKFPREEVTTEEMAGLAKQDPEKMAYHSASDAVSTYYLYVKPIHALIFGLTTIIPMPPEEMSCEESSTLCEWLPEKFRILAKLFDSMLSSLVLLKKNSLSEDLRTLSFTRKQLGQIEYILPEAVKTKSPVAPDDDTLFMKPDTGVSLSFALVKGDTEESRCMALGSLFCSKLLSFAGTWAGEPDMDVPEADTEEASRLL